MKLKEISTVGMSREDWLKVRRNSIGGSEAAALLGLNAWSSPYAVWADKLGLLAEQPVSEAIKIGNDLENYVAHRFTEATGKHVRRKNAILYNPEFPFAHANVDRLIIGEKAGLECKTTNALMLKKFADGEFPAHYYVQCQHYMMITNLPKWYLAVLILGKEFLWFEIPRHEGDIQALAETERDFWQLVKNQTPPPVDASASCSGALSQVYAFADSGTSCDLSGIAEIITLYQNAKQQIADLEKIADGYENQIKAFMQNAESGYCDGFRISWKNQSRTSLDSKAIQSEQPEIYQKYLKKSESRVFRIKEMKEN